ncbi:MAG: MBL fold metallo-hydrolase [Actinomycetota bacterium]|nr:MBL fold metallo-hydrolase [Actinomycetota bacterium]
MSAREVVVLGTASQAPTRARNHVSVFIRFDRVGLLVDCGEGTQRQMLLAGVPSSAVDAVCVTHAHGDHCMGLHGVLARRILDGVPGPLPLACPASAVPRLRLLTDFALAGGGPELQWRPASEDGPDVVLRGEGWRVETRPLSHRVPAVGYVLVEDDGRRMLPDRLAAAGVSGPDVARLQRGEAVGGVPPEDVSEPRPGQRVAVVMDTALGDGARELARDADLLVVEATFLDRDADLAVEHRHLTARQAARLAREAGVRRVVLVHLSQRYPDLDGHRQEAGEEHDDVVVARDLDVVPLPARRQEGGQRVEPARR